MGIYRALAAGLLLLSACSHTSDRQTHRADPAAAFAKAQAAGFAALRRGELTRAREAWSEAHRLRPADPYVLSNLGLVDDALGRHAEAVAETGRAGQLNPLSAALAVNHAFALERAGFEARAVGEYRRALELDPKFEPAIVALGLRAFDAERYDDAERRFNEAVRFHPGRPDGHAGLAAVAAARGEWRVAAEHMARAATRDAGDPVLAAAAGALYARAGDLAEAARRLDAALALAPRLGDALVIRAEVAERRREYADAERFLARAMQADKPGVDRAGSALARGELALLLDQPRLAATALKTALAQDGQPGVWRGRAQAARGRLALRRHDFVAAEKAFKAAQSELGETAGVAAGLASALHGGAFALPLTARLAQLQAAEPLYRRSLELKEDARLRLALGKLYMQLADLLEAPYRRGKYRQAELQLREAIAGAPGLVEAHVRLALLMTALDRVPEARAAYETAVRLDPRASRVRFLYGNFLRREGQRRGDAALTAEAHRQFAAALQADRRFVGAKIGWYLTAATAAAEAAGDVTEETVIIPFAGDATQGAEAPTLEDLMPFFEDPEAQSPDGVIPMEEGDRNPIYSIDATQPADSPDVRAH